METSNIAEVMAWLSGFVDSFDFTRVGEDQSLGRDVAMKFVERIHDRAHEIKGGAFEEWKENAPAYAAWKQERYNVADTPTVRTGQMLSQKSLFGRTTIAAREITMKYGVGTPPDRTSTGVELADADTKRTDLEKAYYVHTGQSKHEIKRPFYEVNEMDGRHVSDLCQQNLNDLIRETNAANGY